MGGFDVGDIKKEKKEKKEKGEKDETGDVKRKGRKAGEQWAEGDTAWVFSDDGHWFGKVEEFVPSEVEGVPDQVMITDDSGKTYREDVRGLMLQYPGAKKEKPKKKDQSKK